MAGIGPSGEGDVDREVDDRPTEFRNDLAPAPALEIDDPTTVHVQERTTVGSTRRWRRVRNHFPCSEMRAYPWSL